MPYKAGFLLTLVILFTFSLALSCSSCVCDLPTDMLVTQHNWEENNRSNLLRCTMLDRMHRWKDRGFFMLEWFRRIGQEVNDEVRQRSTVGRSVLAHLMKKSMEPILAQPLSHPRRSFGKFPFPPINKPTIPKFLPPDNRHPPTATKKAVVNPPRPAVTQHPVSAQKAPTPVTPQLKEGPPLAASPSSSTKFPVNPSSSVSVSTVYSTAVTVETQGGSSLLRATTILTTATTTASSEPSKETNSTLALAISFGVLAFLILVAGAIFLLRRRLKKRRLLDGERSTLYRSDCTSDVYFPTSRGSSPSPSLHESYWRRESLAPSRARDALHRYSY